MHAGFQRRRSKGFVSIFVYATIALFSSNFLATSSLADAAMQSRRQTHFQWLKVRGIFQGMDVVNGTPQLVLGRGRGKTDNVSLGVFSKIIFDYFVERDPTVKQMLVIDGFSGNTVGSVDATGLHFIK